jgi:hypothetical protein
MWRGTNKIEQIGVVIGRKMRKEIAGDVAERVKLSTTRAMAPYG